MENKKRNIYEVRSYDGTICKEYRNYKSAYKFCNKLINQEIWCGIWCYDDRKDDGSMVQIIGC